MKAMAGWKKRNYERASISLLVGLDHLDYLDWPGWVLRFDVGDRVRLIAFNRPLAFVRHLLQRSSRVEGHLHGRMELLPKHS
jgi:hypothetical protein